MEKMPEEQEPTTMAQTNSELPMTPASGTSAGDTDSSHCRKPLPFAWLLFTAMWLLFPIGFVVQVLRTDLSTLQLLAFLASNAAFIAVFLWLMLRYPFPAPDLTPRD